MMARLLDGLGGPRGFGEHALGRTDDGSSSPIDITPIFEDGLNFFGSETNQIFINANGGITFNDPRRQFTPDVITSESQNPEITPYFADVDTRKSDSSIPDGGTNLGATGSSNLTPTDGGTSTGANQIYYDFDRENDRFIVTWDDVGYYNRETNKLNAFQLILEDRGNGNFGIEFRYEDINWTTGDASQGNNGLGGVVARAGWTAGTGNSDEFFELPASGNESSMLSLPFLDGNTGEDGVWEFSVNEGDVTFARNDSATVEPGSEITVTFDELLTNDGDPEDLTVIDVDTVRVVSGEISEGDHQITYTPQADFTGTETIPYTVAKDGGATDTAELKITVEAGSNQPPEAVAESRRTSRDEPLTLNVLENDTDADGDPLTFEEVESVTGGTVDHHGNGTVTFSPASDFSGEGGFRYTISDGEASDTAKATVHVAEPTAPEVEALSAGDLKVQGGDVLTEADKGYEINGGFFLSAKSSDHRQLWVEQGRVIPGENGLRFEGSTAYAASDKVYAPLFGGDFEISYDDPGVDFHDRSTVSLDDAFDLADLPFDLNGVGLDEDGLALDGEVSLDPISGLGGTQLSYGGEQAVLIRPEGVGFRGEAWAEFPDVQVPVGNALMLSADDLKVGYEAGADRFKLKGKATVQNAFVQGAPRLTADLSGDNYLAFDDEGMAINGKLTAENISIPRTDFGFEELYLTANTDAGNYGGGATVEFPFTDKSLEADLGLVTHEDRLHLDEVTMGVDGINYPIGSTGAYLNSISGGIDHLSPTADDPVSFLGGGALTAGPEINDTSLVKADLGSDVGNYDPDEGTGYGFEVNSESFSGRGNLTLLHEDILTADGSIALDWEAKRLDMGASLDVLAGALEADAELDIQLDPFRLNTNGSASLSIPDLDFLPDMLTGVNLPSGNFDLSYSADGNSSNDELYVWGSLDVPLIGEQEWGLRVPLNENWRDVDLVGRQELEAVGSWQVPDGTDSITMTATWTDDSANTPTVEVIRPDDTRIAETDFDNYENIAVVDALSGNDQRTVTVKEPSEGVWDIELQDEDGLGTVNYTASRNGTEAEIGIDEVAAGNDKGFDVAFALDGVTGNETIALYKDTDGKDTDGTLIDHLSISEARDGYTWLPKNTRPDTYHLYATLQSETQVPLTTYADEAVTVEREADLTVTASGPSGNLDAGETATFDVEVENTGPVAATEATLTISALDGQPLQTSSSKDTVNDSGLLTLDLDTLSAGASTEHEVTFETPPDASTYGIGARVDSQVWDPDRANNRAEASVDLNTALPDPYDGNDSAATAEIRLWYPGAPSARETLPDLTIDADEASAEAGWNNGGDWFAVDTAPGAGAGPKAAKIRDAADLALHVYDAAGRPLARDRSDNAAKTVTLPDGPDLVYVQVTSMDDAVDPAYALTFMGTEPPRASDDTADTTAGDAVTVDVLNNDTDPDGDDLRVVDPGTPAHGQVSRTSDGNIAYQPDRGFTGTDSFTYRVGDGNDATDTAEVTVTVNPADDAPDVPAPVPPPIPDDDGEKNADGTDDDGVDDGVFDGDGDSNKNGRIDLGLEPTSDFEEIEIDGVAATRGMTTDRDTQETVEVLTVDAGSGDDADESATLKVPTDMGVAATVPRDNGLIVTQRQVADRQNLTTVIDRAAAASGSSGSSPGDDTAAPARDAFLDRVMASGGIDVVEIVPTVPDADDGAGSAGRGSEGGTAFTIDVGNAGDDQAASGGSPTLTVVDTRGLAGTGRAGDTPTFDVTGSGPMVVRGPGSFRGTEADTSGGDPDVDRVLGDDNGQTLFFGPGDDTIRGRGGDDTVASAGGDDALYGGPGADTLSGGAGADTLFGGAGADTIKAGAGDRVIGGTGDDTVDLTGLSGDVTVTDPSAGDAFVFRNTALAREDIAVETRPGNGERAAVLRIDLDADGSHEDDPAITLDRLATAQVAVDETEAGGSALHLVGSDMQMTNLSVRDQISALYLGFLDRAPNPDAMDAQTASYEAAIEDGVAPRDALLEVAESLRTNDEPGQLDSDREIQPNNPGAQALVRTFVGDVYERFFARAPSADGEDYWTDEILERLEAGDDLAGAVLDIAAGARDGNTVDIDGDGNRETVHDATTLRNRIEIAQRMEAELEAHDLAVGSDLSASALREPMGDVGPTWADFQVGIHDVETLVGRLNSDDESGLG